MTKSEAVRLLIENGLPAFENDGSVMIETGDHADYEKMRSVLRRAGYDGSYGWKMAHTTEG